MSPQATTARKLAQTLLHFAARLLPASRADWAKAMRAELAVIDADREALVWALGCVLAGCKERISVMLIGNLKVSRWIVAAEMLLCFVPLSIGCWDQMGTSWIVLRRNLHLVHGYLADGHGWSLPLGTLLVGAVLAATGPLGLVAAYRLLVLGRPLRVRWLRSALLAGPIAFGLLMLAARLIVSGPGAFSLRAVDAFDFWAGILMLSFLPAVGAAHLSHLDPLPGPGAPAV